MIRRLIHAPGSLRTWVIGTVMRDKLGPGTTLSYCTNVHPGFEPKSLEQL
jgi:hypothetical protein